MKLKILIIFKYTLISLFLFASITLYSQEIVNNDNLWLNMRIGAALGDKYIDGGTKVNVLNAAFDLSYKIGSPYYIAIQGFFAEDKFSKDSPNIGTIIKSLSCLFGYKTYYEKFKFTISSGISYLNIRTTAKNKFINTLNIPFDISAYYIPNHIGFGINIFENFNNQLNYFGVNIGLQYRIF